MSVSNALEVKNLSFGFGKKSILTNISLTAQEGCITAIIAPNGTGKTTLFHNILGVFTPHEGEVWVKGKNILAQSTSIRSSAIAYVPQEWQSPFDYNVLDVVMMGKTHKIGLFGVPKAQDRQEAIELLEEIGISHLKNAKINQLSGGQRQMVLLARALLQDCPVLLLDEPTSHLDIKNQSLLFRQLKIQTAKKLLCVLINIHDPNLMSMYADKVYMLKDGKNFCHGKIFDVMNTKNLSDLYGIEIDVYTLNNRLFICPILSEDNI